MAESKSTRDGIERRKRSDGSVAYRVLIRRAGLPPISKTFRTLADARAYRKRLDADFSTAMAYGRSPLAMNKSVGDALDRYEREVLPNLRSKQSAQYLLAYWRNDLEKVKFSELEAFLPDAIERLAKAKGPGSTANRYLEFLGRVVKKAKAWKWTDRNPVAEVDKFPEGGQRERVIRPAEYTALLEACDELAKESPVGSPARQLRTYLEVLYATACRAGEVRFLRWEDVDLAASSRRKDLGKGMGLALLYGADTKNQQPREVVLPAATVKLLKAHRKAFEKAQHPWVFPGRSMYTPAQFAPYFIAAREKAGIKPDRRGEPLVIHSLRHSAATEMGDGGATEFEIMAAGGWKSPSMVRRYVKGSTRQAVEALRKRRRGGQ